MDGKYVINPQFDAVLDFHEGKAGVRQGKVWGFVDKNGRFIVNPQFERVKDFFGGMARVRVGGLHPKG